MARVFSDLRGGSGRYYYALTSAPGGVQPAAASIQFVGLAPTVFEQTTVFRTPAPAVVTFAGPSTISEFNIAVGVGALTIAGQVPDVPRSTTITNSMPLDYTDLPEIVPTVLFVNTLVPTAGVFSFTAPQVNVTQGGNIGFISPSVGSFTLVGRAPTVLFIDISLGGFAFQGQAPTIQSTLVIDVETAGAFSIDGLTPTLDRPFQWIDADPPPSVTWTTTTGIAA